MKYLMLFLSLIVAGCASGIVPTDKGAYMTQKMSAGGAFGDPQSILADLYVDANKFCSDQGRSVETISSLPESGIPFVRAARATLNFKCIPK